MDISKELAKNQTLLLIMPGIEYNGMIIDNLKKLKGNVCYVTLNKTFDSLKELFKKSKIKTDNILFIDAISKTIKSVPDQGEGVYYVSSPGAMTELSLTLDKFLRHNFDYLIFDSLTNLLVYESKAPVSKFVSALVNKIKTGKTKAVFYALSIKEQSAIIAESGMFVDKVLDLDK
jgi:archaellum biogenesis ATPase FlaH